MRGEASRSAEICAGHKQMFAALRVSTRPSVAIVPTDKTILTRARGTNVARTETEAIMKPLPHSYRVALRGTSVGYVASSDGVPDIAMAPPRQYDGPGDVWSPEQMLLAAVASCFVFTFRSVARAMQATFADLDVSASGTVARSTGVVRFIDIVLHVKLTVPAGSDRNRLRLATADSENRCLIAASLSCPVRLETEIVEDGATRELEDEAVCV
jgi:organic hydroperoxide reductase OsmC/OhrA